ncbi:MAG: putative siderophore transport system ATP-binding protein YusV [bacterium ADurb.Bin425]|nr:MAG: putative siderophore transport system ATP-binding protein YusV [bacterium ADurb.Bin425]
MIKLQTRSLSLGFAQPLFRDLDLSLESGRITAIMGPNGCGKSTLIRALARLKKPQRGTVELNGQDIWQMSARDFAAKVAVFNIFFGIIPSAATGGHGDCDKNTGHDRAHQHAT